MRSRRARWALIVILVAGGVAGCAPKAARGPSGELHVDVTEDGFVPDRLEVPKGEPVTLVFTRKTDQTCVTDVRFGRLGTSYPLPLNQPVRVTIASIDDTLGFVCPMDMYRGTLVAR